MKKICSFDAWINKTTRCNSYTLLINCDPFQSVFLLLTISLLTAVQECSPKFCESRKKRLVMEFFLEKHRLQQLSRKDFIKGSFLWNLWNFSEQFFLEQLSANVFVSGVGLAQPYQNKKYLIWITKKINTPLK